MSSVRLPRVPPPQTGAGHTAVDPLLAHVRLPNAARLGLERWMLSLLDAERPELGWARTRYAWLDRLPSACAMLLSTMLLLAGIGVVVLVLLDGASERGDSSLGVEPTRPSPLHQIDAPWPPLPAPEPPPDRAPESRPPRGERSLERAGPGQSRRQPRPYHPRGLQAERQGEFAVHRE